MAHVTKATRGASGGLTRHFERYKKENGEYIKFNNQDIDPLMTDYNYNLAIHQQLKQMEFIKQRTSEVHCPNRKELNVLCSWVVTAPKNDIICSAEEHELFFQESYNFLENRYGKENVISAYVHHDESSPHMHFAFVPVIYDAEKKYDKVCAKEVVNRRDLQTFHKDLSKHLEMVFGRDVGVLNEATKDGNKSIEELKAETREKVLGEYEKQVDLELQELEVQSTSKKAELTMQITEFEERKTKVEKAIERIDRSVKDSDIALKTLEDVERINPQKAFTGGLKGVTYEDVINLKETAKSSLKAQISLKGVLNELDKKEKEIERLNKLVPSIKQKTHYAMLESENQTLEKRLETFNSTLNHFKVRNKQQETLIKDLRSAFNELPEELQELHKPDSLKALEKSEKADLDKRVSEVFGKTKSRSQEWEMEM